MLANLYIFDLKKNKKKKKKTRNKCRSSFVECAGAVCAPCREMNIKSNTHLNDTLAALFFFRSQLHIVETIKPDKNKYGD